MKIGQPLPPALSPRTATLEPQELLKNGQVLAIQTNDDKTTLYDPSGKAVEGEKDKSSTKMRDFLLPRDYPNSVSTDYSAARRWNAVRNLSGSVVSYMGLAASLQAVGVGSGPLSIGLAWMLRDAVDGVGKFAGSVHAKEADRDPRGMTFKGEIINSIGSLGESTLAVAPGAFLAIAPATQIVKAMGASYKSAAEGPIDNHMAINHNLGEMRSKNSNQDLVVNAIGGAVGFGVDHLGRHFLGAASVPLLVAGAAAVKIWATHNYVKAIDLNPTTEKTVLKSVRGWLGEKSDLKKFENLELGSSAGPFVADVQRFNQLRLLYTGRNYLLDVQGGKTRVLLHKQATGQDQQCAVFQAALLQRLQHSPSYYQIEHKEGKTAADHWAVDTSLRGFPADALTILGNIPADDLRFDVSKNRAEWEPIATVARPSLSREEFKKLL